MFTPEASYDPEVDAAYLRLNQQPVRRTVEFRPSVNIDLGQMGKAVGIEFISPTREEVEEALHFLYRVDASQLLQLLIDAGVKI